MQNSYFTITFFMIYRPAPLLKDVDLSESKARELYLQCIQIIRTLYHQCHLIHADLSEFNLLYHEGGVYVIDVSQSVEHDHPRALEFLRKDCTNITDFFRKKGVSTLTVKELFDFVTDVTITSDNIDQYLDQAMVITSSRTIDDITQQEKIDEEVFKNSFIPRTLDDVIDFERDYLKAQKGDTQEVLYQKITGLKHDLTGPQDKPVLLEENNAINERLKYQSESSSDSDDDNGSDEEVSADEEGNDDDGESEGGDKKQNICRPRNESPNSRKERKKEVKEAQREKRKDKIPKHVKKRKVKTGKKGK